MIALFRSLAIHQAHFHKALFSRVGSPLSAELASSMVEGLVYDGLWLTKFPLLFSPTYGVARLDALNKAWQTGAVSPEEVEALRPLVDADVLRFVLALAPEALEGRIELFFGGRAMNKPLWNYLLAWFEHGATLRGRLAGAPSLLDTAFL